MCASILINSAIHVLWRGKVRSHSCFSLHDEIHNSAVVLRDILLGRRTPHARRPLSGGEEFRHVPFADRLLMAAGAFMLAGAAALCEALSRWPSIADFEAILVLWALAQPVDFVTACRRQIGCLTSTNCQRDNALFTATEVLNSRAA